MSQTHFKIMNVLLSDAPQFIGAPRLLTVSTAQIHRSGQDGVWTLEGPGTHDFTTYFNAVSVNKWRAYTRAQQFGLHLELRGAPCAVQQMHADVLDWDPVRVQGSERELGQSDSWQVVDMPLAVTDDDVLVSFVIDAQGPVRLRNAYFYATVEEDDIHSVELALCTTTFRKEDYITRNISLIKEEILSCGDPIAEHFRMHVVDNGRTLDASELESPGVEIHPNPNAGGAGGFSRGMIEAMEQEPRATHVLLMDDDVLVSPESIIRTYNLLSLANDEYAQAFVAGAMFNMDQPNYRWEELGYVNVDGSFRGIKPKQRMDVPHDVINNETFDVPWYLPGCADQQQSYAAWWYCAIPMSQIDEHGLPLPLFVRGDDVEYSRRCKPEIVSLNGICIWHMPFHQRYSAAQECYQMTRNCFIDQATSDFAPLSDFRARMDHMFELSLKKFNYDDAALILDGFEDFLKGPGFIMEPGQAERSFMDANKHAEKLLPTDELADELSELGISYQDLVTWRVYRDRPFTRNDRALFKLTQNGNRFTESYREKGKVAIIDNVGWSEQAGKFQHAETIVSLDLPQRRAIIRHVDRSRFKELWRRHAALVKDYEARKDELAAAYRAARPEMTSVDFWKRYLGIS